MPQRRIAFALGCCMGGVAVALGHRASRGLALRPDPPPSAPWPKPKVARETLVRLEAELERVGAERNALAAEVDRLNEIDRDQAEVFRRDNEALRRHMDELADAMLLKAGL